MSQIINISELSVGYKNTSILSNINLVETNPKLIGIVGRNGMGKSTFLKTLAGLIPALSGEVTIKNTNLLTLSDAERSKLISFVTASQSHVTDILVEDFICFGRYPYSNWLGINSQQDNHAVDKAIELCGIEEFRARNYQTLSDGEKQRINIARAIAQDTPLIILDEPTAFLDVVNKFEVFRLLKQLAEEHQKTVIFSTHQIELALQMCDQIWSMSTDDIESHAPEEVDSSKAFQEIIQNHHIAFDRKNKVFKPQ